MAAQTRVRGGSSQAYGRITKRERAARREQHRHLRDAEQSARNLRTVIGVPKRNLVTGAIVWAHIPFAEIDGEKLRPAIVVSRDGDTVQLVPITSARSRFRFKEYFEIKDWRAAGLARPCGAKLHVVGVDLIEIVGLIGQLQPDEPLMWALTVYEVLAS